MPGSTRHDTLLKNLFKTFFADLMILAMPRPAAELALDQVTWLDKEIFVNPFEGRRVELDLVAQVPRLRVPPPSVLVHVEIERQYRQSMGQRMHEYYLYLQLTHRRPVLSLVVFLRGGRPGVRRSSIREALDRLEVHRFSYSSFGLSGCEAEDYVNRKEPLAWALASLMGSQKWSRAQQKIECLRPIARSTLDEARQAMLVNAVGTYLQLDPDEEVEYMKLLEQEANVEVGDLEMTWFDRVEAQGVEKGVRQGWEEGERQGLERGERQGLERGVRQGMLQGARQVVLGLLADRFGPLPPSVTRRVEAIRDADRLLQLSRELLRAESLAELGLA